MTTRKWVSWEVEPSMALWCEWRWESLWISRWVGVREVVICGKVSWGVKMEGRGRLERLRGLMYLERAYLGSHNVFHWS